MDNLLDDFDDTDNLMKERHGCVTAWLWFSIVASVFTVVTMLFGGDLFNSLLEETGQETMSKSYIYVSVLLTGIGVYAYIMLLKWHKNGFFLACGLSIIGGLVGYFMIGDIFSLLGAFIGPVILFAILQIQKNGVSAWNHLE